MNSECATPNRGDNWDRDVEATAAEMVVAKALGKYYEPTVNNLHGTDTCGLQVRHTRIPSGQLIVRDKDKDSDIFVLVTGESGRYEVRGWMEGREAKSEKYLRRPEQLPGIAARGIPAYFVPQSDLRPLSEIRS